MIMGEDSKIDVDEQELEISLSKSSFGTSSPIATNFKEPFHYPENSDSSSDLDADYDLTGTSRLLGHARSSDPKISSSSQRNNLLPEELDASSQGTADHIPFPVQTFKEPSRINAWVIRTLSHHTPESLKNFYFKYVDTNLGLFFILLSQFFNVVMGTTCKVLEEDPNFDKPLHPLQILFARQSITYTACFLFMFFTKVPDFILGPKGIRKLLIVRGFTGFFGVFGMYYSLQYLIVTDAVTIGLLIPVWASVFCFFILRERFTFIEAIGSLTAISGVILIARPTFLFGSYGHDSKSGVSDTDRVIGTTVGFLGAIGGGMALATIRVIGKRAHPLISVSYFSLWCVIVSTIGLLIIPHLQFVMPRTTKQWVLLCLIGFSGFTMQFLLTAGLQRERPSRVTPIYYTQIVFATMFDLTIWHKLPSWLSWTGILIIVFSTALVTYFKPKDESKLTAYRQGTELQNNDLERNNSSVNTFDDDIISDNEFDIDDPDNESFGNIRLESTPISN